MLLEKGTRSKYNVDPSTDILVKKKKKKKKKRILGGILIFLF